MTTKTDRSRIIQAQVCPRKRYLEYHYQGRGVRANRVNLPLTVGSCVHKGLELLLTNGDFVSNADIELAIAKSLADYDAECHSRSFAQEDLDISFVYQENRALIEALIRLYAKVQLPRLLERFEVLEVEKEIELSLVDKGEVCHRICRSCGYDEVTNFVEDCAKCFSPEVVSKMLPKPSLVLMSRPDAILRERSTGSIYVLSFKTSAGWMGELSESQNRWDVQGISELVATESWLRTYDIYNATLASGEEITIAANIVKSNYPEKVAGIKMEHLIKGSYSKALTDQPLMNISKGQKYYNSLLIHPYANSNQFAFGAGDIDLRFEYEWTDPISGKTNRLGKDWKRCNIWDVGEDALKVWIDFLADSEEGMRLLERLVVCPDEYYRNQEDVDEWLSSTRYQELKVAENVKFVEGFDSYYRDGSKLPKETEDFVNAQCKASSLVERFPKYRHSCFSYNSPCQFIPICWESQTVQGMLDTGELQWREPNHSGEVFEV